MKLLLNKYYICFILVLFTSLAVALIDAVSRRGYIDTEDVFTVKDNVDTKLHTSDVCHMRLWSITKTTKTIVYIKSENVYIG